MVCFLLCSIDNNLIPFKFCYFLGILPYRITSSLIVTLVSLNFTSTAGFFDMLMSYNVFLFAAFRLSDLAISLVAHLHRLSQFCMVALHSSVDASSTPSASSSASSSISSDSSILDMRFDVAGTLDSSLYLFLIIEVLLSLECSCGADYNVPFNVNQIYVKRSTAFVLY